MTEIYSPYFGDFSRMNVIHFAKRGTELYCVSLDMDSAPPRYYINVIRVAHMLSSGGLAKRRTDLRIFSPEKLRVRTVPNPFNADCEIVLESAGRSLANIEIYNLMGRKLAEVYNGIVPGGTIRVKWSAKGNEGNFLPSGIYLLRVSSEGRCITHKVFLLR